VEAFGGEKRASPLAAGGFRACAPKWFEIERNRGVANKNRVCFVDEGISRGERSNNKKSQISHEKEEEQLYLGAWGSFRWTVGRQEPPPLLPARHLDVPASRGHA
jgi:hypothetical protein